MDSNIQNRTLIAVGANENETYEFQVDNSYQFSTKGQKLKVEMIEEADGILMFACEGVRYPAEIVSVRQNTYEVMVNGVSYTFTIETPFSLKRRQILAANAPVKETEEVRTPMPGKIVSVAVKVGQEVNQGDPLLVLEAMKMQNTLTAPTKGVVTLVNAKEGTNVGKDELLIEIKM
ncbi:MAG: biotin/lipoyl-binding protein [Marinilabiliaceae bacterium]|nr:biotin/lipoyl-binding protein [Marinilabiliaceae bacterium]